LWLELRLVGPAERQMAHRAECLPFRIATGVSMTLTPASEDWIEQARDFLEFQVSQGYSPLLLPPHRPKDAVPVSVVSGLVTVREDLGECTRCPLHQTRRTIVFGEGNPRARIMFIGEGPGADEDRVGRPFVGRAGQLLTKMIQAMGLDRSDVYIANIVKCRPPGNRDPHPVEISTCFPFLEAQIEAVKPKAIVALGRIAVAALLGKRGPISDVRGKFQQFKGIPVMPTYHPSFLLRQEPDRRAKAEAWSDLKQVMSRLGLPAPGTGDKS
jgi:uracil-DNA glycosylase